MQTWLRHKQFLQGPNPTGLRSYPGYLELLRGVDGLDLATRVIVAARTGLNGNDNGSSLVRLFSMSCYRVSRGQV
jgi:hypothetical protein